MLKKQKRLKSKDFSIKRRSFTLSGGLFSVKTLEKSGVFPKYAVVVSKKVEKSAVKRNQLKRLVFSAIKELTLPDKDMIFYIKKTEKPPKKADFSREMSILFKK